VSPIRQSTSPSLHTVAPPPTTLPAAYTTGPGPSLPLQAASASAAARQSGRIGAHLDIFRSFSLSFQFPVSSFQFPEKDRPPSGVQFRT
jgi:hypothetical protein